MSSDRELLANIGRWARHNIPFVFCESSKRGWVVIGAPRALTERETNEVIDRISQKACEALHVPVPKLDSAGRRQLLSAGGFLCRAGSDRYAGTVCPDHVEARALEKLGVASIDELLAVAK